MGLVHYLASIGLSGTGAPLHVADFVPDTHPLRNGPMPSHGLLSWPPLSTVSPNVSRHGPARPPARVDPVLFGLGVTQTRTGSVR